MKIYLPTIIANSPTNLPVLEKTLLYYIIDIAFKDYENLNSSNTDNALEININEVIDILSNSTIDLYDIVTQAKNGLNNLSKVKLSLIENGLHIKISPIESIYIISGVVYVNLNPVIIEYLDQVFVGNYEAIDLSIL